jgi:hypothetical protein
MGMGQEFRFKWLGLFSVVFIAVAMRWVDFPKRYVKRDFDEREYVQGGLALWEGITPTYEYAPAGPQTWISCAYAAGYSARYLVFPTAEERAAPRVLRPFVAGNHALFDIYRDWSLLRWIEVVAGGMVAVAGVAAAYKLGEKRGGWMAGVLVGGTAACLPIFVEMSGEAKPYAMAWGFAFIALAYAAYCAERPKAWRGSAIFMGLAITCRVDMLMLLPLAWADIWPMEISIWRRIGRIVQYTAMAGVVAYLISPWLITDFVENLRAIVSVRFSQPTSGPVSILATARDVLVHQGLGIGLILVVCALIWISPQQKKRPWLIGIYVLLLSFSIFKGTGFGLRHQGAPIVALTAFAAVGFAAVINRWPRIAPLILVLALALPLLQAVGDVVHRRHSEVPYHATEWVQRHVPPGVRVYLSPNIHDPLPTADASNTLWEEVTEGNSWTRKVDATMQRFHVAAANYPRAFSEANMVVERGLRREWFILGSRSSIPDPRYDIRVFSESVVFSVKDISAAYHGSGGVLICNDVEGQMPTDVGTPVVQWLNSQGQGIRIYCSPDILPRLIDTQHLQEW